MSNTTRPRPRNYDPLKPRLDVHEAVTAKIVAAIEAGAGEFQMPWHRPGIAFTIPENALTGSTYRGSNILSLWIDADEKKFERQVWATYKQWQELGAQVRGGEKGSLIVKYGEWVPKDKAASAGGTSQPQPRKRQAASAPHIMQDDDDPKRVYAKPAWVFNVAQVDGYAVAPAQSRPDLTVRLAQVDAFIANTGAEFREGGHRAFYRHRDSKGDGDFIQMPPRDLFTGTATSTPTEAYESTRLHELGHWSGASHRLDRQFGDRFGDHAYAFEEIVVEISAAYMCAHLEITNTPRADHAQYIAHWIEVLKGDSKAIFTAANQASRIVDYLHELQPRTGPEPNGGGPGRPGGKTRSASDTPEGPR